MSNMTKVGIRQLKQNATDVLKHVKAGRSVEVTERGRPIALIVPLPKGGSIERLIAEGRATPAEGNLNDLPAPRPPKRGQPLPSQVLARMREEER
jgi:prevent-host-death family protein